jgi:hypothetical protein
MTDSPATPARDGLLTPASRAVAALVLALGALLGPNALTSGLQLLAEGITGGVGPGEFGVFLGVAVALPALLALALVRTAVRDTATDWTGHVARAAAVVALIALVGAALSLVGGLLEF